MNWSFILTVNCDAHKYRIYWSQEVLDSSHDNLHVKRLTLRENLVWAALEKLVLMNSRNSLTTCAKTRSMVWNSMSLKSFSPTLLHPTQLSSKTVLSKLQWHVTVSTFSCFKRLGNTPRNLWWGCPTRLSKPCLYTWPFPGLIQSWIQALK